MRTVACLSVTALALLSVRAQQSTSLFLPPNFADLPLSVDVGGVDGQGRTTYIVQAGSPAPPDGGFFGTATLVQGSAGASFTYVIDTPQAQITLGYDCAIRGSDALCAGSDDEGNPTTDTVSNISFLEVQLGTTIAPDAPAPSGGSSSALPISPSGSGDPSPEASQSGSGNASGSSSLPGQPTDGEEEDDDSAASALLPSIPMLAGVCASILLFA